MDGAAASQKLLAVAFRSFHDPEKRLLSAGKDRVQCFAGKCEQTPFTKDRPEKLFYPSLAWGTSRFIGVTYKNTGDSE